MRNAAYNRISRPLLLLIEGMAFSARTVSAGVHVWTTNGWRRGTSGCSLSILRLVVHLPQQRAAADRGVEHALPRIEPTVHGEAVHLRQPEAQGAREGTCRASAFPEKLKKLLVFRQRLPGRLA
jgi:hypothetical protein